jgi:hypothetical protein
VQLSFLLSLSTQHQTDNNENPKTYRLNWRFFIAHNPAMRGYFFAYFLETNMALRSSLQPQPHQYIGDFAGRPLDNGMVYFGEPNKDPEFYPINIYSDSDLSIPLAQPVRTKGGFMYNTGKMTEVYASQYAYSVKIVDNYGAMVFYEPRMERISIKDSIEINTKLDVTGSVTRTQGDKNSESISLLDFIPPSEMAAIKNRTSTYDCSAALEAAVATGKRVNIPTAGTYKFVAGYSGTTDFDVVATTTGVTFDFNDSVANYPLQNSGSVTLLAKTFAAPSKGAQSVTFDNVSGISVGDWLCFYCPTDYSYSKWRANYRAGEWVKVLAISGNKVIFEKPFTDSLVGLVLELYKLNSVVCKINNITLVRKGKKQGIVKFSLSSDANDTNVTIDAETESSIMYDRCTKPVSNYAKGVNAGQGADMVGGAGDDYGISFANCQSARVYNADIYSRRHAIALGGGNDVCSVPVTDFRCYNSTLNADPDALAGSADMHGNVRDSSYEDCTLYAGSNIGGGDRCYIKRSHIYSDTIGQCGFARELKSGDFGWIDCDYYANGNAQADGRGVIDIGGNSLNAIKAEATEGNITVNANGRVWGNLGGGVSNTFVKISNRGSVAKINSNTDGLVFNNTTKFLVVATISHVSGAAISDKIVVDNISGNYPSELVRAPVNAGNTYLDQPMRLQKMEGKLSLVTAAAKNIYSTPTVLPFNYPRRPFVQLTARPSDNSSLAIAGQVNYSVIPYQANNKTVAARLNSINDFTAGVDVEIAYTVGIREC